MSGGFTASPEQLSEKSTAVAQVASSIRECVAASNTIGVGGLVYGVLFDPTMLPILSQAKDSLASTIGNVADAADGVSHGLTSNANSYRSVDQFLQEHLVGLAGQAQDGGGTGGR
ncbi:MAG: type VII secretion target [Jatrophihabitantaceae bacterium]